MEWWSYIWESLRQIGVVLLFILQIVWIPIWWILRGLFNVVVIISAPLLYIVHFLANLCYAPIHFFSRFEV